MDDLDCSPNIDDEDTTTSITVSQSTSTSSNLNSFAKSTSSSYNDNDTGGADLDSCSGSESESGNPDMEYFPIMQLPVEVRSKILNILHQRQVPTLRLVNRQWKEEVDQFFEFCFNIYDTTTNFNLIKDFRCRECTIWKLTNNLNTPLLFTHPAYLKVIKVYGPTSAENLANLITASTSLEHLTLTRRANYPWFLNLKDTPGLSNLQELRYLRLNSEEHVSLHLNNRKDLSLLQKPPMMDCHFSKLKHFEILKRFAIWQYSHYVTCILQFVARHVKTLKNIELDLIPLSCVAILDDLENSSDSNSNSSDEDENPNQNGLNYGHRKRRRISSINPDLIKLNELCKLRLEKFCVTTKGSDRDIYIWKSILEKQTELRELRFDWLCRDPNKEMRARVTGFPWIHFQSPIEQCTKTLVHVELASLSMFTSGSKSTTRVVPFDLGIFRNCSRLKSLILRCRENHAQLGRADRQGQDAAPNPELEDLDVEDEDRGDAEAEVLLMINGADLPTSLEQLEIFRFPMLTSGIIGMIRRLSGSSNLRKLFLHECGKTGEFGVSAEAIRELAFLRSLKFLEVIGFNDGNGERREQLEEVFQHIGIPYEGQDTWLEFSDGSSTAHHSLKVLLQ